MRTMPEIAAITVHITSPSCAIWPLISCPRNPPRAPCVSKSNGPVGRTPISQNSSPNSEVRLPWGNARSLSGDNEVKLHFHIIDALELPRLVHVIDDDVDLVPSGGHQHGVGAV